MTKGWVKIHRIIEDDWIWQDKPFSRGQAWIDLILMANHSENKAFIDGRLIDVERGQLITSTRKLSEKWGWSRTKVVDFLKVLSSDKKAIVKSDTKKTVITIINYSLYQDSEDTKMTQKRHQNDIEMTQKSHRNDTEMTQKSTNKNDKNVKNVKKEKLSKEREQLKMKAKDVLIWLNQKADKDFKLSDTNIDLVIPRLKEGFTVEDCKKVIDNKVQDWKGTERDKYLRPSTLFRPSNFEGYLQERPQKKKESKTQQVDPIEDTINHFKKQEKK